MAQVGFYANNRYGAYPFAPESVTPGDAFPASVAQLPYAWIVDARFTFYPRAEHDPATDVVRLVAVRRTGSNAIFEFRSTSAALADVPLLFTRPLSGARYASETVESESYGEDVGNGDDASCEDPLWEGTLVTGDLTSLFDGTVDGWQIVGSSTAAIVEPALLLDLRRAWVESLNVANRDRTRQMAYAGECEPPAWGHPVDGLVGIVECLNGPVEFSEGYNCEVSQSDRSNAIVFRARVGAGRGEPCGELPWSDDDAPPISTSANPRPARYTGSWLCDEVLRSLNGAVGPRIALFGRSGILVREFPEESRILVDVGSRGVVCPPRSTSASCSPVEIE